MAIAGATAWVVTTDSGHLISLDLGGRRETAAIEVGSGGTHVAVGDGGSVFVGRYDTGGRGEHLVVVEAASGTVGGVATGSLGGLAQGEAGAVWALEKAGRVLHVDAANRIVGRANVVVDANEHMELVTGAGARWVSSDGTPVRRIAADASVVATIETGGGIPLAFAGGLVWGARPDELWAIDPATDTITRRVALVDLIEILALDVAADGSEAWIAARRAGRIGTVVRLELPSGRVLAEHPVSLPAAVELASDRAWVTNYDTNEVLGFAR